MIHRTMCTATAVLALAALTQLTPAAQIRRQAPAQVPLEVAVTIDGQPYTAKAPGSCTYAPKAAIYGVLSETWSVQHQAEGKSLELTLWKPADGSASMFSLALSGKPNASISTVRRGEVSGQGTVTLVPAGKGGTLTIDAKSKTGTSIAGTIKCEAFTPAIAGGGD